MLSIIFSACTYTKARKTFTLQGGKRKHKKESLYLHKNFTYLLRLCEITERGNFSLSAFSWKAAKVFFLPFLVFELSSKRYLHVIMPFKQVITFRTKSTKNSNQIKAELWMLCFIDSSSLPPFTPILHPLPTTHSCDSLSFSNNDVCIFFHHTKKIFQGEKKYFFVEKEDEKFHFAPFFVSHHTIDDEALFCDEKNTSARC